MGRKSTCREISSKNSQGDCIIDNTYNTVTFTILIWKWKVFISSNNNQSNSWRKISTCHVIISKNIVNLYQLSRICLNIILYKSNPSSHPTNATLGSNLIDWSGFVSNVSSGIYGKFANITTSWLFWADTIEVSKRFPFPITTEINGSICHCVRQWS